MEPAINQSKMASQKLGKAIQSLDLGADLTQVPLLKRIASMAGNVSSVVDFILGMLPFPQNSIFHPLN